RTALKFNARPSNLAQDARFPIDYSRNSRLMSCHALITRAGAGPSQLRLTTGSFLETFTGSAAASATPSSLETARQEPEGAKCASKNERMASARAILFSCPEEILPGHTKLRTWPFLGQRRNRT